jgi:formate hydrogenlyase subunit 4
MIADLALAAVQAALLMVAAPLFAGLIAWLKARAQMRRGAPIEQRVWDLLRLLRKESVVSADASWLARFGPYLVFAAAVAAAACVPVVAVRAPSPFAPDLVVTVALLAAMRAVQSLVGLEAGTAFGGMAASRHLSWSALAEPALVLSAFTLALGAGSTDLGAIVRAVASAPHGWLAPSHLLALAAMWMVTLSEAGRLPADNPATHLELTMIHEGMLLDVSGRHLALLEWASAIRQLLLFTLVANLFLPWGIALEPGPLALAVGFAAWAGKLAGFALIVAVLESVTARVRLFRVPEFLGMAFLLALLAFASDSLFR